METTCIEFPHKKKTIIYRRLYTICFLLIIFSNTTIKNQNNFTIKKVKTKNQIMKLNNEHLLY